MKKILVIDDVEVCRYVIAAKSDAYGFEYHGAGTVSDALDYLKGNKVDAIILDWHIKQNQITESLDQIKEAAGKNVVICLMTAIEGTKALDLLKNGDVNAYIPKPVNDSDLESFLIEHKLI